MRKVIQLMMLVVVASLVMNSVVAQTPPITSDTLPSSVLQQMDVKLNAIQSQQTVLINSLADFKVQHHEDMNTVVDKEAFEEYEKEINTQLARKPEMPVIVLTCFITSGIWFGFALLLKAKGVL